MLQQEAAADQHAGVAGTAWGHDASQNALACCVWAAAGTDRLCLAVLDAVAAAHAREGALLVEGMQDAGVPAAVAAAAGVV